MNNSSRIAWIDYAKILVVLLFTYTSIQRALFRNGLKDFGISFHIADSIINALTLPLCFFVAGTLLRPLISSNPHKKFYCFLFDKIFYTFIIWTILQGVLEIAFSGYTGGSTLILDIYYDLTSEPSNHFWVMPALLVNFLLAAVLLRYRSYAQKAAIVAISAIAYVNQDQIPSIYPLHYLPEFFIYFVLGQLYLDSEPKISSYTIPIATVSLLIFAASQASIQPLESEKSYSHLFNFALAIMGILASVGFCKIVAEKMGTAPKLLVMSIFPIFLLHSIIGSGAREILQNSFSFHQSKIHLILGFGAAIFAPILLVRMSHTNMGRYLFLCPPILSAQKLLPKISGFFDKFKSIKIVLIGISIIIIGGFTIINFWSNHLIKQPLRSAVLRKNLTLSQNPTDIVEGKRLAQIYGCYIGCHGSNMEGIVLKRGPITGILASANLTKSIEKYSTSELDGIIRHGVWPDNSPVIAGMPSSAFNSMTDDHLIKILSFIKSYPKQNNSPPKGSLGLREKISIINHHLHVQADDITLAEEFYGKPKTIEHKDGYYLARSACSECHNYNLMGKASLKSPPLLITKAYSLEQFRHLLKTGIKLNGEDAGLMGLVARNRFSKLTDTESQEIFEYLNSL